MKKYILVISSVLLLACAQKEVVMTDVVKANIVQVNQITDSTNLVTFLKGVPFFEEYSTISLYDSRLLRYGDIVIETLSAEMSSGKVERLTLSLFEETQETDVATLKEMLTEKFGEPDPDNSDEGKFFWKDENTHYALRLPKEGYSGGARFIVNFVLNGRYYYMY